MAMARRAAYGDAHKQNHHAYRREETTTKPRQSSISAGDGRFDAQSQYCWPHAIRLHHGWARFFSYGMISAADT